VRQSFKRLVDLITFCFCLTKVYKRDAHDYICLVFVILSILETELVFFYKTRSTWLPLPIIMKLTQVIKQPTLQALSERCWWKKCGFSINPWYL